MSDTNLNAREKALEACPLAKRRRRLETETVRLPKRDYERLQFLVRPIVEEWGRQQAWPSAMPAEALATWCYFQGVCDGMQVARRIAEIQEPDFSI